MPYIAEENLDVEVFVYLARKLTNRQKTKKQRCVFKFDVSQTNVDMNEWILCFYHNIVKFHSTVRINVPSIFVVKNVL